MVIGPVPQESGFRTAPASCATIGRARPVSRTIIAYSTEGYVKRGAPPGGPRQAACDRRSCRRRGRVALGLVERPAPEPLAAPRRGRRRSGTDPSSPRSPASCPTRSTDRPAADPGEQDAVAAARPVAPTRLDQLDGGGLLGLRKQPELATVSLVGERIDALVRAVAQPHLERRERERRASRFFVVGKATIAEAFGDETHLTKQRCPRQRRARAWALRRAAETSGRKGA